MLRVLFVLSFLILIPPTALASPVVEKTEPPNWWAGHSISTVRVLVRGEGFAGAKIVSVEPSLKISNVLVNDAGHHLFFDVDIAPDAKPGKYSFTVQTTEGSSNIPFEITEPLPAEGNFRGLDGRDVIYLIMTDRFADGDVSNNKDVDRTNPRAWHGGDIRGVISKLDYLKDLGITAIWLTPWYDNPNEANQCDKPWCPNTNYHGYHAIDHYGVEDHFGSMADLQELVREAHKKGIKIIQDQVANHVGVQHPWVKRPPLPTWFSPYQQNTFNNSVLLSPNGSQAERDKVIRGWFNELLPDLDQDEPEVSRYLIQNALWWVGMTGIDGIRQDTIQYMPRTFIRDWSAALRKQYPNIYLVGEVLDMDPAHTAFFQGGRKGWDGIDTSLPSVFDFNIWMTSRDVFTEKRPARALRDALKYDALYPNTNALTTVYGNHDLDRFMSSPDATVEGAMMRMAFLMSIRGIPQIYYGDEIAMAGGHDPDNRRDFPGGFPGDKKNVFTREGRTADEQKMFEQTKKWIAARRENISLTKGKTQDLHYDNESYIFQRSFQMVDWTAYSIVAVNTGNAEKIIDVDHTVPTRIALVNVKLKTEIGNKSSVEVGEKKLRFRLPPKSVSLYSVKP